MNKKVSLHPFEELVTKLRADGFEPAADRIALLMRSSWTTSSEFIGELGLTVSEFQREHPEISPDLKDIVALCMREVRIVWPDIQ